MKTIRQFTNIAEANFTQSLLVSAGLMAVLADEHTFTMEPGLSKSIRLQVAEEDRERAEEILNDRIGFEPLADDFVPPETSAPETVGSAEARDSKLSRGVAFLLGGMLAIGVGGLASFILMITLGGRGTFGQGPFSPTFLFVAFLIGGWIGLGLRYARP